MAIKILSLGEDQEQEKPIQQQYNEPELQKINQEQEESWPEMLKRILAGTAAQTVKNVATIPGNLINTAGSVAQSFLGNPNRDTVPIPEIAKQYAQPGQMERLDKLVKEQYANNPSGLSDIGKAIHQKLPSEEDVEGFYNQLDPEGKRKPRNQIESAIQEIGSDIATLMAPLGPLGAATKAREALKIAGWSNATKQLSKLFGATEDQQNKIKMGTSLLTSLGMTSQIKDKAKELYNYGKELIKPGEKINTSGINRAIDKSYKEFLQGPLDVQGKKELLDAVEKIGNAPTMNLDEAWLVKKQLSDLIQDVKPNSSAGVHAAEIQREFNKALKNSSNKEFSKVLTEADDLYRGVKDATKWSEYIWDTVKGNKKLSLLGGLFNPALAGKAAIGSALALHGSKALLGLKNFATNPTMAKEYISMMRSAAKLNKPGVIKHATKIEKQLDKIPELKQQEPTTKNNSGGIRILSLG